MIQHLPRPVWAEINLDALAHNIREVKASVKPETLVTAVIKADGYGHGAVEIGQTLLDNGADRFAVATLSEAIQLRKHYSDIDILILGYTPKEDASIVIEHNITQTLYDVEDALAFQKEAEYQDKMLKVHIKVDTGMRRLGFETDHQAIDEIAKITRLSNINVEGIFTHFAVADEKDKSFTEKQVLKFNAVCKALEDKGIVIPIKHVSNSAAIIDLPDVNYDMVRAGIMLYGLYPSKMVNHDRIKLREVMSLKAKLSHVKIVPKGQGISYGLLYAPEEDALIGTMPIGYADGFSRRLTGKVSGIYNGEIRQLVGRICMDQCMIDLTGTEAQKGDTITLFGTDGTTFISIDDYADALETINYEIVCMISKRVPRVYVQGEEVIAVVDYLERQ